MHVISTYSTHGGADDGPPDLADPEQARLLGERLHTAITTSVAPGDPHAGRVTALLMEGEDAPTLHALLQHPHELAERVNACLLALRAASGAPDGASSGDASADAGTSAGASEGSAPTRGRHSSRAGDDSKRRSPSGRRSTNSTDEPGSPAKSRTPKAPLRAAAKLTHAVASAARNPVAMAAGGSACAVGAAPHVFTSLLAMLPFLTLFLFAVAVAPSVARAATSLATASVHRLITAAAAAAAPCTPLVPTHVATRRSPRGGWLAISLLALATLPVAGAPAKIHHAIVCTSDRAPYGAGYGVLPSHGDACAHGAHGFSHFTKGFTAREGPDAARDWLTRTMQFLGHPVPTDIELGTWYKFAEPVHTPGGGVAALVGVDVPAHLAAMHAHVHSHAVAAAATTAAT